MNIVVLDAATLGEDLDLTPLVSRHTCTVYQNSTPEEVKERIADAEVIVINKIRLNGENLPAARSLRLICIAATGYDNIDVDYCRENGIAVCNVKGYSTDSVAQLTVAMALSLWNRLPEYTAAVNDGRYTASGCANMLTPTYREISGKTWGIVGLGNIGKRVAEVARALGCTVLTYQRTAVSGYEYVSLEELLRRSDIVSLHTPLSGETRGLIGREELQMMKRGALLINVARGAVTDEEAVADALLSGHLGGVGVDVYSCEPFSKDHPMARLCGHPNVCLTPHIAWSAVEARERCLSEIVENIADFSRGGRRNRVD